MRLVFPYIRNSVWVLYASNTDAQGRSLVMDMSTRRDVMLSRKRELQKLNKYNRTRFTVVRYKQVTR